MSTTERTTDVVHAESKRESAANVFRIDRPATGDGGTVVSPLGRRDEHEIVAYADPLVRERLTGRSAGELVRLELTPVAGETDGYVATRVLPGSPGI